MFSCRLAAVNFFLGCVGITQVTRIVLYQQRLNRSLAKAADIDAIDATTSIKES
jgi:hypothetical protein